MAATYLNLKAALDQLIPQLKMIMSAISQLSAMYSEGLAALQRDSDDCETESQSQRPR